MTASSRIYTAAAPNYPDLDSNQGLDLRRVQCVPLHHRDFKKGWAGDLTLIAFDPVHVAGVFLV